MSSNSDHSGKPEARLVILNERLVEIPVKFHNIRITGAEVVAAANKAPAENFVVLIPPPVGGLRQLADSESTDLDVSRDNLFYVIESDRVFRFEVNSLEYEWPLENILGTALLQVAGAKGDDVDLFRLTPNGETKIALDSNISFAAAGVEKFVTRKRDQGKTIFINDQPHSVKQEQLNGAQIKALGQIESDYQLFLEQPGDDLSIANDKSVKLEDGMRFYSLPPATFG